MNRFSQSLLLTFFLVLVSFVPGQLFRVRRLDCQTQFGPCDPALLHQFSLFLNQPLLFVTPPPVASFSNVSQINLTRRLPATLIIDLVVNRPVGGLITSQSSEIWLVTEDGLVSAPSSQTALPLLVVSKAPSVGSLVSPADMAAFRLLSDPVLAQFDRPLGQLANSSLTVALTPRLTIILDITQTEPNWQTALQSIVNRSKIKGIQPKVIDLRYKSPIVTYH